MRLLTIAALLATLPWCAAAAPTWQTISSEPGKRIELDRTSIKREDGGKVQAQGRVILEKEIVDAKSGAGYRVIEAITRYDCGSRNASTIKRIYKKNESEVVREEEIKGAELPVRTGTLDDKVLREVCRPAKESVTEVAQKANEATSQLKEANEAMIKKDLAKSGAMKGIRHQPRTRRQDRAGCPDFNQAESETCGAEAAHEPAPPKAAPPKASHVVVHSSSPAKPAKPAKTGGYMLELAQERAGSPASPTFTGLMTAKAVPKTGPRSIRKTKPAPLGQRQSPIDIKEGIKVDLEPIKFSYRPSTFRIIDNGHTVQVAVGDSSISLTGKTYELVQFHFHRPSEEKVNGQRFDMVVHLVHKSDEGQLAVVAVLLERGSENPFIQTLWNNMPLEKNVEVSPPGPVHQPGQPAAFRPELLHLHGLAHDPTLYRRRVSGWS